MNILKDIHRASDVRGLLRERLEDLARELRGALIRSVPPGETCPESRLSVVELTIALHAVFDTPQDRIIWDVEALTGAETFLEGKRRGPTQGNGSRLDAYTGSGHNSTSLSYALGLAVSRDLRGERKRVIAVINEASLAAGIAYEAMNNIGYLGTNLIIVLNDDESSASGASGAIASYLNRVLTGQTYSRLKEESAALLAQMPVIGESMLRLAKRAAESVKGFLLPGFLFEELGLRYVGPIDGSRVETLVETFESLRDFQGPVLVHIRTRGETREKTGRSPRVRAPKYPAVCTVSDAVDVALCRVAEQVPNVLAVRSSLLKGPGFREFSRRHPRRFYDVGPSEGHAVTFACGAATDGARPVVHVASSFLQRAFDQAIHDLCIQDLPVTLLVEASGLVDREDPTHHGIYDLSYLRLIPNMILMSPKDANELQHLILTAVLHGGPAAIRLPESGDTACALTDPAPMEIPLGQAERIGAGRDIALIATGRSVAQAVAAAEELARSGIHATVINARFIKPLDEEMIYDAAAVTGRVLTVEENVLAGGLGSAVAECLFDRGLHRIRVRRLGLPGGIIPSGTSEILRRRYGLDSEGIVRAAKEMLERRPRSGVFLEETGAGGGISPLRSAGGRKGLRA